MCRDKILHGAGGYKSCTAIPFYVKPAVGHLFFSFSTFIPAPVKFCLADLRFTTLNADLFYREIAVITPSIPALHEPVGLTPTGHHGKHVRDGVTVYYQMPMPGL